MLIGTAIVAVHTDVVFHWNSILWSSVAVELHPDSRPPDVQGKLNFARTTPVGVQTNVNIRLNSVEWMSTESKTAKELQKMQFQRS